MLDTNTKESLSTKEIKRQEVTALGKRDWEQQPRPFVPSLAGKGLNNLQRGGTASSCAPKPKIYVCISHGKRWIPLWNSSPQRDPREMPDFTTAFLQSQPRWLLCSCPSLRFLTEPAVFLLKLLTIGWEPGSKSLGLPFSWSSWTNLREPPEAAWGLTSAVSGVLCLQPGLAQSSDLKGADI